MTEQALQQLIKRRSDREISFQEFLSELESNGISKYDVHVKDALINYIKEGQHIQMDSPYHFQVSDIFNKNEVMEATKKITLPFPEFLKEIADAGVLKYTVYISDLKTVYYGKNGEEVEETIQA